MSASFGGEPDVFDVFKTLLGEAGKRFNNPLRFLGHRRVRAPCSAALCPVASEALPGEVRERCDGRRPALSGAQHMRGRVLAPIHGRPRLPTRGSAVAWQVGPTDSAACVWRLTSSMAGACLHAVWKCAECVLNLHVIL